MAFPPETFSLMSKKERKIAKKIRKSTKKIMDRIDQKTLQLYYLVRFEISDLTVQILDKKISVRDVKKSLKKIEKDFFYISVDLLQLPLRSTKHVIVDYQYGIEWWCNLLLEDWRRYLPNDVLKYMRQTETLGSNEPIIHRFSFL